MSDDNVVVLPVTTTLDLPPERVLRAALEAPFKRVIVVGVLDNGDEYLAISCTSLPKGVWDLERAKLELLRLGDK